MCVGGGYDALSIYEKMKNAALLVREGKACYERDGVLFYEKEYYLQLLAVLYEIVLIENEINLVDFGGGFGSTYFQNKDKLKVCMNKISWNIVEQKHFVAYAEKYFQSSELKFFYNIEEICKFNCLLFGSSLQYLDNYKQYLRFARKKKCKYIIVDRIPVSNEEWYSIEQVHEPIYEASYPIHIFNENKIIEFIESLGYKLKQSWIKDVKEEYYVEGKLVKFKSFSFKMIGEG